MRFAWTQNLLVTRRRIFRLFLFILVSLAKIETFNPQFLTHWKFSEKMRWERVHLHAQPPLAQQVGLGEVSSAGPGKRWGHTCNAIKGGRFLYIFGGYGKDNCQTNQVHVFDTGTPFSKSSLDSWVCLYLLLFSLCRHMCYVLRLFLVGMIDIEKKVRIFTNVISWLNFNRCVFILRVCCYDDFKAFYVGLLLEINVVMGLLFALIFDLVV